MATVASVASTAETSTSSLSITKPSGLVENDVLLAVIVESGGGAPLTPSGWTQLTTFDMINSSGRDVSIFAKVADSSDVAASTFSFAPSTGTQLMSGVLLRLDDASNDLTQFSTDDVVDTDNSSEGNVVKTVSCTPPTTNSVAVVFSMTSSMDTEDTIVINSLGGTTNPTWTEINQNAVAQGIYATYYGTLTTADTITSINTTATTRQSNTDDSRLVLTFGDRTDATATNTLVTTDTATFSQTATADTTTNTTALLEATAETFTQNGVATSPTQWANESKPTTTWNNETL